jgi:predicted TPR repeat methyltransferase
VNTPEDGRSLDWFDLAVRLREQSRMDDAIQAYRRAISERPALSAAYEQLGKLLYREGRTGEAADLYREWHRVDPSHPVATHLFAATSGIDQPPRASNGFVLSIFDRAADNYDQSLARLGYEGPRLLVECADALLSPAPGSLDILDLGCGTGLCGSALRPWARHLMGVDLSPAMLKKARERATYDDLCCAELVAFLTDIEATFDLIVAADVFCYFGDLEPAMAAAAARLRSAGNLLFSFEELDAPKGFAMLEHGRYAHAPAYVEQVLALRGLSATVKRTHSLRFERGAPVAGLLVCASRTA